MCRKKTTSLFFIVFLMVFSVPVYAGLPGWVKNPGSSYPGSKYIVGVGSGYSMIEAKNKAKAEISSVFSQKIESTQSLTHQADETFSSSGGGGLKEKIQNVTRLEVTTGEKLQGVQIKKTQFHSQSGKYYALAVLDRMKAASSYRSEFKQHQQRLERRYKQAQQAQDKLSKLKYLASAQKSAQRALELKNQLNVLAPNRSINNRLKPEPGMIEKELDDLLKRLTVYVREPVLDNICPGSGFEEQIKSWIEKQFNQLSFRTTSNAASAEFAVASRVSASYTTKGAKGDEGIRWDITIQLKKPGPGPTFATVNHADISVGIDKSMVASRTRYYIGEWIKQKMPDLIVKKLLS